MTLQPYQWLILHFRALLCRLLACNIYRWYHVFQVLMTAVYAALTGCDSVETAKQRIAEQPNLHKLLSG